MKALAGVSGKHLKLPVLPRKHAEDLHLERRPMSSHAWNASKRKTEEEEIQQFSWYWRGLQPTGKCT